jgi:SAM-dependent methyltransferase
LSYAKVCADTTQAYNALDAARVGHLPPENAQWNRGHGPRNYYVAKAILDHATTRGMPTLHVINLSGTNEGKPDAALFGLVRDHLKPCELTWTIMDHPDSMTFTDASVSTWLAADGITRIAHDHRNGEPPIADASADVVLCTEILEHLDYSVGIALLRLCRRVLRPGGLLVTTTPNVLYLGYRALFALGKWGSLHHMDLPEHVDAGLTGHTIYYDANRLSRLLRALEYANVNTKTFNGGHGPGEFRNALTRAAAITLRALSGVVPNSGQVLLVTAERPA